MLELRAIKAGYGGHIVLRDVSLAVKPGTAVAVLGPNGPARPPCSGSRPGCSGPLRERCCWAGRT
jgi:energy-coupling factor transporter ATP-binding protein EcfA2